MSQYGNEGFNNQLGETMDKLIWRRSFIFASILILALFPFSGGLGKKNLLFIKFFST